MRDFHIISRASSYFICTTYGMHCRIIIDEYSQSLPVSKDLKLHVEEISDKYIHHANDAVYRLTLPYEQQDSIAICTLRTTGSKNTFIYRSCVRLGGKWEPVINEWVFSQSVEPKVQALSKIIHSPAIIVEAEFRETITAPEKKLSLFGYELVKGIKLNNSPILHNDIKICAGDISFIPGAHSKTIARAGTKVRIKIPQEMFNNPEFKEDYFAAINIKKVRTL